MKKSLLLFGILYSLTTFGAPCQPNVGCTGISNSNANTITLGGPISTAGAFTLSGAFGTTITVTAATAVTLPTGTHTLAATDGSNATGTWPIDISGNSATVTNGVYTTGSYSNPSWITSLDGSKLTGTVTANAITPGTYNISITGTAAGAPPTGTAGGSLTGTYPNPTLGSGVVGNSNIASGAVDLTTKVSGVLPIANGGTNTNTQSSAAGLDGILYYDGTKITSNSSTIGYNPAGNSVFFTSPTGSMSFKIQSTQSGSAGTVNFLINRVDNTVQGSDITFQDSGTNSWQIGLASGSSDLLFFDNTHSALRMDLEKTGKVIINSLTASELTATNGSQELVSGNLTGDVTSSQFATTLATVNTSSGVPGSFGSATQVPVVTINGKGLVTAVNNTTITGVTPGGTAGGDLTGSYPNPTIAANAVTYAKFQQVALASLLGNPTGAPANVSEIALGSTLTFSGSTLQTIGLTGDMTSSANSFATTLATVNTSPGVPGSFGSATQVPVVTINGKGLVTAVSNTTISGVAPGGSAGGDLTGTYPNPTVAANAITYAKFQQVAANSVVGNSTGSTANATAIAFSATGGTSNIASRDSNGNMRSNNTGSVATLVTSAAGTTALTVASSKYQVLQGTNTQTYTLPDATTLFIGNIYEFKNESTGTLTVNNHGGSLITTIPGGGFAVLLCTAIGSANGSWDVASSLPYATANTATTLVERDSSGNFSAGTITATLNGNATTASGAPPTGAAGGSFLNGTYPNPGMVANSIGNAQIRQGFGYSVIGNSTGSVANVADLIASSTGQVLRRDASLLEFGSLDLSNSNTVGTSVLPIANGGTNNSSLFSAVNAGAPILFFNGTSIANDAGLGYDTTFDILKIYSSLANPQFTVKTTLTGSANSASRVLDRGDQANGGDYDYFLTAGTSIWQNGLYTGSNDYFFKNPSTTILQLGNSSLDVTVGAGNLIINTVNKGVTIKSAAVSAGTANAAVITSVTLSGGAVTINDSYVNTSTVCYFSVVTAAGTPGTAYGVTVASGTVSVKSTSALDTSTGNIACIKGN